MLTFSVVVFAAIVFEYSNGFHDAANAIATVVSTKVLTPRQAIVMAAIFNLTGALLGGAVASTIGKGLVDTNFVTMATVLCGMSTSLPDGSYCDVLSTGGCAGLRPSVQTPGSHVRCPKERFRVCNHLWRPNIRDAFAP